MAEETKKEKIVKEGTKKEETNVSENKSESPKKENAKSVSTEKSTSKKAEVSVRDYAIANAGSLRISPKQAKYVCKMIKGKDIDTAIVMLENVMLKKQPVKMTGREVPHQKGKGISGAKYPITAAENILGVVKQLKANCTSNGVENPVITLAISNQAPAPYRVGGRKAKRASLHLEAKDKTKLIGVKK